MKVPVYVRLLATAALLLPAIVWLPLSAHSGDHGHSEVDTSYGCVETDKLCLAPKLSVATDQLETMAMPNFESQKPSSRSVVTVPYVVTTRGAVTANLDEFKKQANETLNDGRGWARMNVRFVEVASGGMFSLYLAEASTMTSFSALGCDTTYSCNVGNDVIINQDRWMGATPSWNAGGGSLRDYRHMVVNHETGHWLGHGHEQCTGAGQPAKVMQQQSISLQGCSFNPWPVESELYSSTLGI